MNVIVQEPPESLRLFVHKLWHISADHIDQQDICLPVLQYELMFNFSEHFSVSDPNEALIIEDEENWVSGLYTRPQRTITSGKHETFGVFLKPWALQSLTGIPASELTNQIAPGNTVFCRSINELNGRMRDALTAGEKLALLERFLTKRLTDRDIPAYLVYAVDFLQRSRWHDGIIKALAQDLRISPKSLTLAFKKHIGISPGRFLHLRLLNDLASDLAQKPHQSLTELAHQHGFFDQAHLNHLFKSLTNLTPGDYRNHVLAGAIDPASPCYIRASADHG
ncbi:AraC family transcriptional regulator [Larkinella punicea]|nr:helix-turn-helix domain-containing protein [Larkinella punicea]